MVIHFPLAIPSWFNQSQLSKWGRMRIIIKSSYVTFSWAVGSLFAVLLNIPLCPLNVMEMSVWNKPMESTTATNQSIGADGAILSRVNLSSPLFSVVRVRLKKKKKKNQTNDKVSIITGQQDGQKQQVMCLTPAAAGDWRDICRPREWSCEPSSTCGPSIRFEKCVPLHSEESWHSFWFVCKIQLLQKVKEVSESKSWICWL